MRVLLVEDDRRIASDVVRALKAAGYVVETVSDGEEAWFRGDTEDYGAIVLDLGLPGMDGLSVLKRWRANGRATPVLILTARGSWAERVDGIDAGADDYLPKPFPADARVLVAERQVTLTIGDRRVPVRVAVAADLARVSAAAMSFAKDLAGALALLGVVLAAATSIQVALGLRPLAALRRGIADIRSGRSRRLPNAVPVEVRPLVEEVNAMLDTQEREISRSRGRAADLAHGLKTPLAALAADIGRLRERGESVIASDIEALSDAMTRHVDRELAKARLHGGVRHGLSTELALLVRSLVATLMRTPAGADISFEPHVSDSLLVPFDRTDLAEVLGNLLENTTRHAASCVRVTASPSPAGVSIAIEDDGRGIAPIARSKVLERGVRLDQREDGTGLGLAIVQDLLDAYGWQLDLASSELGGLKATIAPRSASIEPSKTGLDFAASKVLPANLTPR